MPKTYSFSNETPIDNDLAVSYTQDESDNHNQIFFFDQDPQQPPCNKTSSQISSAQSCEKNLQTDQPNTDIFLFDQEEEQQNKENTPVSEKINPTKSKHLESHVLEQPSLKHLKSQILFKQSTNTLNNISSQNIQKKPQIITQSFKNKIHSLKKEGGQQNIKHSRPSRRQTDTFRKSFPKKDCLSPDSHEDFNRSDNGSSHLQISSKSSQLTNNFSEFHEEGIRIEGATIKNNPSSVQLEYLEDKKALKVTNMKEFLFTQLSSQYKINAIIKKVNNQGLFGGLFSTKYIVSIEQNNKFLFSVLKQSGSRFLFSMAKENISEKNKNYLGKLIGNFSNTNFMLYDYGFDPKQTKSLQYSHKQVAFIRYEQSQGPRKFEALISTNNKGFHSIQTQMNVLTHKWNKKDRKHLNRLFSKQPELDQVDGNFKLDFKGMVGKASVKNFILGNEQFEDGLIFARRNDDTYALEVKSPFSLMQAAAVCISSIHHKTIL